MFSWIWLHLKLIVGIAIGVYETFANLIPTVKNWSIIAKIIELLKLLSDNLNKRKAVK
jgi:hypothetical protein